MGSVVVSVIGTLLGVLIGVAAQQMQAKQNREARQEESMRDHTWQREDSLNNAKRSVYAEYLRSISASYAQAIGGQRRRTEDGNLYASTAEIVVLAGSEVSGPAQGLTDEVLDLHNRIAEGAVPPEEVAEEVGPVDRRRRQLIELFKRDLGIETSR